MVDGERLFSLEQITEVKRMVTYALGVRGPHKSGVILLPHAINCGYLQVKLKTCGYM